MPAAGDDIQGVVGQRRLAAILVADVSGYSRLMGVDEEGTLARMRRVRREIVEPALSEHHGRLINAPGDSLLAIFDSPLEAVRCALVIQQSIYARNVALPRSAWFQYRIGLNLGDIIFDPQDGTVYGDGVNVAARLEAMAEPGGVLISGGIYEQIKNKLVCGYQSLGDERLKNITDPVHVYKVLPDPAAVSRATRPKLRRKVAVAAAAGILLVLLGIGFYGVALNQTMWRQISVLPQQLGVGTPVGIQNTGSRPVADPLTTIAVPKPVDVSPPDIKASRAPDLPDVPATATAHAPPMPVPSSPPPPAVQNSLPPIPVSPPAQEAAQPPTVVAVLPPVGAGTTRTFDNGKAFRDCEHCPEMVRVQGGSFRMGSREDASEQPIHTVSLQSFALSRYPVTNREWRVCAEAKACRLNPDGPDQSPVRNVSWVDVQDYVQWLSKSTGKPYRLPSEAEWEYAARAGTITRFWWGDKVAPKMANCRGCGEPYDPRQPLSVGSAAANPFGLHDMGGSVAQWVADCWHPTYQNAPADGSPRTEAGCPQRVLRGGSWRNSSDEIRPGSRAQYDADVRHPSHGFRVARAN